MSVQAGILNFDGRPIDRDFLGRMRDAMGQRCPDDGGGEYISESLGMLFRAFYTTTESRLETQPHCTRRGFVLTWDGRLDNRDDLVEELRLDVGSDETDMGIVAAAFERWKTDCFRRFVGDWAITIWDPVEQTLLLARDYVGIRHLYYYLKHESLTWCTHLASLVLVSDAPLTLNEDYVAGYLSIWPKAHETPYREIQAVPPGNFVSISRGKTTVCRYWNFNTARSISYKTDAEYEAHFFHIFREAVRRRLRSNCPILAELSGGLDSSSIVCMADDITVQGGREAPRVDTISLYDLKEPDGDDFIYFTKIEEKRGRKGHHIDVGRFNVSFDPDSLDFCAAPGSLGGGQDLDAERRRIVQTGGYRAVLSGVGGDEFLGGIPDPLPQLADLIVKLHCRDLARELMAWSLVKRRPWIHLLLQSLCLLMPGAVRAMCDKRVKPEKWIDSDFARRHQLSKLRLGPEGRYGFLLPSRRELARTLMATSWQMTYAQQVSGCYPEKRYPYLDQNLFEFLMSIPASQLLRPGERRSLMRRALRRLLPQELLMRKTKGTTARSLMCAFGTSGGDLENLFRSAVSARFGIIDEEAFMNALHDAKHGKVSNLVRLTRGITIELWLRTVMAKRLIINCKSETQEQRLALVANPGQ